MKKLQLILLFLVAFSCKFEETISTKPLKFSGYVASEYDNGSTYPNLIINDDSPIQFPLKFQYFNDYLFIQEYGKGIHIFQSKGLTNPIKVAMLSVAASTDFNIKNNVLSINSAKKLYFLDLSKLDLAIAGNAALATIKIVDNVVLYPNYPPVKNTLFACPDTTMGFVKAWRKDSISKIECFR